MKNVKSKSRKVKFIIVFLIVFLTSALYLLADRYLIEHVEASVPSTQTVVSATPAESTTTTDTAANTNTEETSTDSGNVTYDDWNYSSDEVTISVEKVQTGSGSDMITYYVADVVLNDSSHLKSALAKNFFGTNIVEDTSEIASDNNAILAINGDYYGFRSDGVIIRNGILYRDEPARMGMALYIDGTMEIYDETEVSSSELLEAGVVNTFSFGPALVTDGDAVEYSGKVTIDTNMGNRSIQNSNPRTGIGMISANHYVFVVVDGRSGNYSRGMTLAEFSNLFVELGCTEAYNLDGGGSSTMYFMGRVVNNPLGKGNERATSDIIYIG